MILHALYQYCRRNPDLPKPGFERKEFKYQLVIDRDGTFRDLACLLVDKKRGTDFLVPRTVKRAGPGSEKNPQLLWDSCEFVLGEVPPEKAESEKDRATALRKRDYFAARIGQLPEKVRQTPGIRAVLEFYRRGEYAKVAVHELWEDFLKSKSNLLFQLKGELEPVTALPELVEHIMNSEDDGDEDAPVGRCLVTGEVRPLARLMGATPIPGGKSNSSLISFQRGSGYDSYGKEQCFNAPIGKDAEFCCTTALNHLLGKDSRNKFLLGDLTMAFWTKERKGKFLLEDLIPGILGGGGDHPDRDIEQMRTLLHAAWTGALPADEANNEFYFLGLSPNAARISVSFWKTGTIGELGRNLEQHFLDFELETNERQRKPLTVISVLASLALEYKLDNLSPNLKAKFVEAIFDGSTYPVTLLIQAVQRIRADRKFPPFRVAAIKAYLNRKNRLTEKHPTQEITMSLNPENPSIGYQCGRLFAVLEKAQTEASPGLNSTICDRFYGAAAATPVTVFGRLVSLSRHHLEKLSPGRKVNFRNQIGEIIDRIRDFPAHLNLEEQGRFAIGYYQQNQELYRSKSARTEEKE